MLFRSANLLKCITDSINSLLRNMVVERFMGALGMFDMKTVNNGEAKKFFDNEEKIKTLDAVLFHSLKSPELTKILVYTCDELHKIINNKRNENFLQIYNYIMKHRNMEVVKNIDTDKMETTKQDFVTAIITKQWNDVLDDVRKTSHKSNKSILPTKSEKRKLQEQEVLHRRMLDLQRQQ